jgi:predicted regulator of Ras-like GTPase activity (Roadblock/LC7/MglB family)
LLARPEGGVKHNKKVMAISLKSKFAGFFRGLLQTMDEREPVAVAQPRPAPAPPSPPPAPPRATNVTNLDEIELPLGSIVAALPIDLRAKLMTAPPADMTVRLQAETVISQLAFGAVKIAFGELRRLAPGIFANSGGELDNKLVSLPLNEILPRINPALLARRTEHKVEVAEEIAGPFAGRGRGFSFTTQSLKAPAAPEPAKPVPFTPPAALRQVVPPPVAPQFPPRSTTPAANGNGNGNGHTPRWTPPPPNNGGHGSSLPPGLKLTSGNGNGNAQNAAPPAIKFSAVPVPLPAAAPRPEPAPPTIFASLGDLCENWPEPLKNEITQSPLADVSVPLAGSIIMPGLKRGRVAMTWKELRTLAQPSSVPSPNDPLELELPLKVIAPLFLAAQKQLQRPQAKAAVGSDIPDLFFGFPQAPAAPAAPPPRPPEPKNADTNYYVWGENGEVPQADEAGLRRGENPQTDFLSRQAHPKEVVALAAGLPGVAGAVVAMQDGLRVASQVPAELNADTLAAFLPQIFERVNQSSRELRMGALNNVSFTVGNVPWKIFRVNAVYFAAFGRTGEQLPSAQLAQLAAELDRKKQK